MARSGVEVHAVPRSGSQWLAVARSGLAVARSDIPVGSKRLAVARSGSQWLAVARSGVEVARSGLAVARSVVEVARSWLAVARSGSQFG